jgi:hypothetical protein
VAAFLSAPQTAEVLILRPDSIYFRDARDGLLEELDNQFTVHDYVVTKKTTMDNLTELIAQTKPKILVLMESKSVTLYHKYQRSQPEGTRFPPALVLMTSFAAERINQLENATGIRYEVPAVSLLNKLRSVVNQPINRVGVLYSSDLQFFYKNQKRMCRIEEIELVGLMIDESQHKLDKVIKRGLRQLMREENVDAIWILNDNVILSDVYLTWAWLPQIKRFDKPVIASFERLVSDFGVGQFTIVPDHAELGIQAASMIF